MNTKLEKFIKELNNKNIAIIGAGVSNIPLLEYLSKFNCNITLFDNKNSNELSDEAKKAIDKYKPSLSLGENYLEKLHSFDIIFRSPSFLPTNKYLEAERKRGALITTEVEQVIKLAPCKIIGITGSKGKTTTTTITNEILTKLGYHTFLGGNIGIPLFNKIEDMKKEDIVVLELSSFQLMGMKVSPNISVITNISPDHLDIHNGYEEYIDAKKYIYKNQSKDDILILNKEDKIVKEFKHEAKSKIKYFGTTKIKDSYILKDRYIKYNDETIIDTKKLVLRGKHNYLNICAALNAIEAINPIPKDKIENIVKNINSVHHRLEFIREIDGIKWYNDSASTTPDKSLAGINAFDEKIVLIAGGYDKNISYKPLAKPILKKVSKLILFGNTKNKIYDAVMQEKKKDNYDLRIYIMDTLEEVVDVAYEVSVPGEVVLFSPASASFDMFKNAYQRGDLFKDLVNKL
ncbi:MAG: UDP-N-acetylmuramoyl-L-alanine--D-glutamate ligase [Bacilli bacterium]|nr:UDP-N-acetylmuramoyl-L-alanine--D-glutamate ligase [Bacilli bacterium]